jgi:hypothetical protein
MDNNQEQTKGGLRISLASGFKLSGMVFELDRKLSFLSSSMIVRIHWLNVKMVCPLAKNLNSWITNVWNHVGNRQMQVGKSYFNTHLYAMSS